MAQTMRRLIVAQFSALVTVATIALADPQGFNFTDDDEADSRVDLSVSISLNLDRKLSVSEMTAGDIRLKRSANGVAKEVKGYCVRANYDGLAGLRITSKNSGDDNAFSLQNDDQDRIPLTVMIQDALAKSDSEEIQPNRDLTIKTLQDNRCDTATTNLEVSVDFDNVKARSGLYKTTLALIFVAK